MQTFTTATDPRDRCPACGAENISYGTQSGCKCNACKIEYNVRPHYAGFNRGFEYETTITYSPY